MNKESEVWSRKPAEPQAGPDGTAGKARPGGRARTWTSALQSRGLARGFLALCLVGAGSLAAADADGWMALFNGRNLDGWDGDPALWSVENGAIVGSTDGHPIKQNTFLIHKQPFADFILKAEVKLRNHNSGIQFRSVRLAEPGWIASGYQADCSEAGDRSAWGNFYEERGRGRGVMKTPDEGWRIGRKVYHKGDWNEYEILAQGHHIRLKLNGAETIDTTDDKAASGIIAIQLHMGEPMRVEVRNIRLKVLK